MPGRRIEVQLRRQLALLIEDNRVLRAVHISSGAGGRTPTGSFRVYRKERYSWSVPFKVWLPWASYFTGGIAFHEYPSVPTYAASHGCVRVNRYDAADALRLRRAGNSRQRLRRGIPVTPHSAVRRHRRRARGRCRDLRLRRRRGRRDRRPRPSGREPRRRPAAHHHGRSRATSDGARRRARARRPGPAGGRRARRRGHPRARSRGRHRPRSRQAPRYSRAFASSTSSPPRGCLVAKVRPWDLTIASIRPVSAASATADLSDPYLGTDQAVVLRRGLPRLSTLATCAARSPARVRGE